MTNTETKTMKMADILDNIRMLARSQGFYGRLLRRLQELETYDPDNYQAVVEILEAQEFTDPVSMVLYFET